MAEKDFPRLSIHANRLGEVISVNFDANKFRDELGSIVAGQFEAEKPPEIYIVQKGNTEIVTPERIMMLNAGNPEVKKQAIDKMVDQMQNSVRVVIQKPR